MEAIDTPEDWLALPGKALGAQLASFEGNLRCPICSEMVKAAMTAKCGHAFCSACVREWLGRSTETKFCPTCKANRGLNKETRVTVDELRPCPPLDKAAAEFKAVRAQLLAALSTPPAPAPAASSQGSGTAASGKRVRKAKKFDDEDEDYHGGGASSRRQAAASAAAASSGGRRALRAAEQQQQDRYWEQEEFHRAVKRCPSYHTVKEAKLRSELVAVGLGTADGPGSLVWKHKTFLRLAYAEKDNVRNGKPSRALRAVVKEVEELYRVHHSGKGRGKAVSGEAALATAASQASFKDMVKQVRARMKAQKKQEQELEQGQAQEEEQEQEQEGQDAKPAVAIEAAAAAPSWEECEEEVKEPPPAPAAAASAPAAEEEEEEEEDMEVEIVGTSTSASASASSPAVLVGHNKRSSMGNGGRNDGKRARTQALLGQGQAWSWGCRACTFSNAPTAKACAMCDTPRPPSSSSISAASAKESRRPLGASQPSSSASAAAKEAVLVEEIIVEDSRDGFPVEAEDGNGSAVPEAANKAPATAAATGEAEAEETGILKENEEGDGAMAVTATSLALGPASPSY